ncbi:MAG: hypothetical protein KDJ28_17640 [Candidatus Competibacteraceae bacterium]|nr:hypothetical protein [Candidatus Competibacteraceae bacterium]
MSILLLIILFALGAAFAPRFIPARFGWLQTGARVALSLAAVFMALATSFVIIDQDKVGHLKLIYGASELPPGHIIAMSGEAGPQAEILGPGFNFKPLLNILYDVEQLPVTEIPEGHYGYIVARDGRPLRADQFLADAWPDEQQMLDAAYFLTEGKGQKGPQLTVLKPGRYRLNQYLFEVYNKGDALRATSVPAGFVAVIKSNVQEKSVDVCQPVHDEQTAKLSIPLVPRGCRGVWSEPLLPGTYYLNRRAYEVALVDTRIQTWQYQGGYARRRINLTLNQNGQIEQTAEREEVVTPENAADNAVLLRVEGWEIPQDLRILAQVTPEDAPFVVASVGDLQAVEDKIITPTVRSIVRNVTGSTAPIPVDQEGDNLQSVRRVLDLQDKRPQLEQAVLDALIPEARNAGVSIREVRFGDPVIPPELLLARKREQLAQQMITTFRKEQQAQEERIKTEKARATAEQQPELVRAEIQVEVAKQDRTAAQLRGEGEKLRLQEIAAGQQAQAGVLGKELTYQLAVVKEVLAFIAANPDAVKVPNVLVEGGESGSLPAAAAVFGFLGNSTVARGLGQATGASPVPAKKLYEK